MSQTHYAPAKINLWLRVFAPDETGYHPLDTLFCAIDLQDELVMDEGEGIELEVTGADVGPTENNLAYRAAQEYFLAIGEKPGVAIKLDKNIPAGAGLGGGSSDAATTLVGQNLGAGRPDRAERSGWLCTWQGLAIMSAMSALFYLFAPGIAGLFTQDAWVAALVTSYLRINAIGEPFLAFSIVLGGALQGAGDTRFAALVSILTMWLLRLPLTHWLCLTLGLGASAAWWVMAATTAVQGLLIAWWFRRGQWKTVQV